MAKTKTLPANLFQIKVQLRNYKPIISRTFLVSENDSFEDLHVYIQEAFGLDNYHLWHFVESFQDSSFEIVFDYDEEEFKSNYDEVLIAEKTKLKSIFVKKNMNKLAYEYDYGDSWEFDVDCQKILPYDEKLDFPKVIKTKGSNIVEDCGGVWVLEEMREEYVTKTYNEDLYDSFEEFEEYLNGALEERKIEDIVL